MVGNLVDFLDWCDVLHLGFEASADVTLYLERILSSGEKTGVERIEHLDAILPVGPDGSRHALYWIALLWINQMGLIEHETVEGGLERFELTEGGTHVLRWLREKREGLN